MANYINYDETITKKMAATYDKLAAHEQVLVQLLAIIYTGCNQNVLMRVITKLGLTIVNGKSIDAKSLSSILKKLKGKNIIVANNRCHSSFATQAMHYADSNGMLKKMAQVVQNTIPTNRYWDSNKYLRELRIAVQTRDSLLFNQCFHQLESFSPGYIASKRILTSLCSEPFRPWWFSTLPVIIQARALDEIVSPLIDNLEALDEDLYEVLQRSSQTPSNQYGNIFRKHLAILALLQGNFIRSREWVQADVEEGNIEALLLRGSSFFLEGDERLALSSFEQALKHQQKASGRRKVSFNHIAGVFYALLLLKKGGKALHQLMAMIETVAAHSLHKYHPVYRALNAVVHNLQNQGEMVQMIAANSAEEMGESALSDFFISLCLAWTKPDLLDYKHLQQLFDNCQKNGYSWLASECAAILAKKDSKYKEYLPQNPSLLSMITVQEPWQRSLEALKRVVEPEEQAISQAQHRLVWLIGWNKSDRFSIEAKEQKRQANGKWSKGRTVSFYRLGNGEVACMTSRDIRVAKQANASFNYDYYRYRINNHDDKRMLLALVGHPLVFLEESPTTRVEIVRGNLELIVDERDGQLDVRIAYPLDDEDDDILIIRETSTRIKVIELSAKQKEIAQILAAQPLQMPAQNRSELLPLLSELSSLVTVHSSLPETAGDAEKVVADTTIHAHILPWEQGLRAEILLQPIANGPYFKPGEGGKSILAEIDGKRYQAQRDLKREKKLGYHVADRCTGLSSIDNEEWQWTIADPEECLEMLYDLRQIPEVQIKWPEGEKFQIKHYASPENLRVKIEKKHDWFGVSGELSLDDESVLTLKELLTLWEKRPGRFIPLADGQFLALTEKLRQRLEDLMAYGDLTDDELRVHPLAALPLEDLTGKIGELQTDDFWKDHLQRIKNAHNKVFSVPSTLCAELRSYQSDGFQWLAQLAHWGVGACLADDMGVGKTIQALTLMLHRATGGPALVVAPTSVCTNWILEIKRFAPTLRPIYFADRRNLKKLGSFDVLIVSYGLLQNNHKTFAKKEWHTIVLDEAQAIKNMATKRSKAAMSLQGEFKLITTGTPIENHLGELWNLFRFINPGLLGSWEKFRNKFATPIEKNQDRQAQKKLKKLVQPFILRRLKSQVLDELPSRTEITLHVEMSKEEATLYEALRQKAVEHLEKSEDPLGQKRIKILAELMKLRRACCDTSLAVAHSKIPSSKIKLLNSIVAELIDNNHKALVFSQFVDYLKIISTSLDKKGYSYQYLDGSTPAKERQKRVDAFQKGEGDLFLISLKAGGVGLNLTAADYVIHMDPWWNPAVEDQAADRAHRIGQQRPVTIYRLVTRNTIEEKIVALHNEKRDLATGLLEGTDLGDKISAEQLLQMIRETAS